MTTALLIIHGLLAVALLGAITHQAVSVWLPARKPAGSFVGRFRAVPGVSYANAVVVLYLITAVLGGVIYPGNRGSGRAGPAQPGMWETNGGFRPEDDFAALGPRL